MVKPKKILLVEDAIASREIMKVLLKLEGFEVITAKDGVEALALAGTDRPDIIITDVHMPRLDGLQLIRILRRQPKFSEVPIVALTAYGSQAEAEAKALGADKVLHKPINANSLGSELMSLLI